MLRNYDNLEKVYYRQNAVNHQLDVESQRMERMDDSKNISNTCLKSKKMS